MIYYSTKTWDHVASAAFRQPKANSHCAQNHGYGLTVKATFAANELDKNNWVMDFGALKSVKALIEFWFDHKTIVAYDDPHLDWYQEGERRGILTLRTLPGVGVEKFAEFIHSLIYAWMMSNEHFPRCWIKSVEVMEHTGNSAIYELEREDTKKCVNCGCNPQKGIEITSDKDKLKEIKTNYEKKIKEINKHVPCDYCSSYDFSCTGLCKTREGTITTSSPRIVVGECMHCKSERIACIGRCKHVQ